MNITENPDALALAQEYRVTMSESVLHLWAADARDTMRRQHERIAELEDAADIAIERIADLEAQLSAIGAGGVEQRRAVHEAVLEEREECAKVCDELVSANACARQIRARGEPEHHAAVAVKSQG